MSLLASLNSKQREAVLHTEGPLLVLAGAGSGKTRVVVTRVAYLILEKRVPPGSILAVTFTNKAAGEMRERVMALLAASGAAPSGKPAVSTFHSFCVRLLRRYGVPPMPSRKEFSRDFLIFDDKDQRALIKEICRELGISDKEIKPAYALGAISRAKNEGEEWIMPASRVRDPRTEQLNHIFEAYRRKLVESNALDFDDLLLEGVRLLNSSKRVLEAVRARYRYLLVDEYQDTNRPQYELMKLLAGGRANVCVVGDEDQAIYSWRGASISNILGFESDYPSARIVRLEQNYRSTGNILKAASAVVANNSQRRKKRLWSAGAAGERPALYRAADGHAEARYVARALGRLLDSDRAMRAGVLYRTNAQSRLVEEALRREGRPFVVVGGLAFYQRAEVKDMLAYVRAAVVPEDAVSLRRIINVPARGIGKSTLQRLHEKASREGISLWEAIERSVAPPRPVQGLLFQAAPQRASELPRRAQAVLARFHRLMKSLRAKARTARTDDLLAWIYDRSGYRKMLESKDTAESQDRIENVKELIVAARDAADQGVGLHDFFDSAALVSDSDGIDQQARIQLMTLHTAKGLEFPAVAMIGLEEGLLPHQRSLGDASDDALEEERRLCYVGMTRARQHLLLTCAAQRRLYGAGEPQETEDSRFLSEIPEALLDDRSLEPSGWSGYGAGHASKPRHAPGPAKPAVGLGQNGVRTHDSVAAVADFFKQRGMEIDAPVPAAKPPVPAEPDRARPRPRRQPRSQPRVGGAVAKLRAEGPLAAGTRVRHAKFGVGVVRRREGDGPRAKVTVHFSKHGMKKLVAQYANLVEL